MKTFNLGDTKGLTRKLDNLGRITLPKEFRDTLNINIKDKVEIYLLQDGIFIKKV